MPDPPEPQPASEPDEVAALRREAASWRRRVRELEATLAGQAERIAGYERQGLERIAAERLANPADLTLAVPLDELRDDDGNVSTDKANAAIDRLLAERPHWSKPAEREPPPPVQPSYPNLHAGPRQPEPPAPPSFGSMLKNA